MTEGTEVPLAFKPFIFSVFVPERSEALVRTDPEGHLKTYLAEGTEAPLTFSFCDFDFKGSKVFKTAYVPERFLRRMHKHRRKLNVLYEAFIIGFKAFKQCLKGSGADPKGDHNALACCLLSLAIL